MLAGSAQILPTVVFRRWNASIGRARESYKCEFPIRAGSLHSQFSIMYFETKTTAKPNQIMMHLLVSAILLSTACAHPVNSLISLAERQATNCPLYLPRNNFEYPHLIVPISAAAPDAVFGNSYTPSISPHDFATIFNFDVPAARAGQTCSLVFSLPKASQLVTTSFSYTGPGTLEFVQYQYNIGGTPGTTWNNQPVVSSLQPVAFTQVTPGSSYKVWTGDCGPGGLMSWRLNSPDSCLWYFQDYNDCAIGVYIVYE